MQQTSYGSPPEEIAALRSQLASAEEDKRQLIEALRHCEQVFLRYAKMHMDKGNIEKADANTDEAYGCDQVIRAAMKSDEKP